MEHTTIYSRNLALESDFCHAELLSCLSDKNQESELRSACVGKNETPAFTSKLKDPGFIVLALKS